MKKNNFIKRRKAFRYENWKIMTVPNILTFFRIFILPFLVLSFYIKSPVGNCIALFIFVSASITDYADGYIARRFKQVSKFGSFLDPIADKLLISLTLLMLAGFGRIRSLDLIPTGIILCREIIISGLREFLSALMLELPVAPLAKYKTMSQMMAIILLLCDGFFDKDSNLILIGSGFLWISSLLTLITGLFYIRISMVFVKNQKYGSSKIIQKSEKSKKNDANNW